MKSLKNLAASSAVFVLASMIVTNPSHADPVTPASVTQLSSCVPPDAQNPAVKRMVAATATAEARNGGKASMKPVIEVIWNRACDPAHRYGMTLEDVVKKPFAFSVWNPGEPSVAWMEQLIRGERVDRRDINLAFEDALELVDEMLDDRAGRTLGRCVYHYYAPKAVLQPPPWARADRLVTQAGGHLFFVDVDSPQVGKTC